MQLPPLIRYRPDWADIAAITALYVVVVGTFWLSFAVLTTDREILLFITFAVVGLLGIGVVGPVAYSICGRGRALESLGLTRRRLPSALMLGASLAAMQFAVTLWGYDLPNRVDWVPLLLMSVVVGLFEAIFFRGFIQLRLEASFGLVPSIIFGAGLYSLYHVGYEMGVEEMGFLFGLGLVYAAVFRLVSNILVLWPLLTPLGAFYNNLEAGDIELPWMSMLGFGEVLVAMIAVLAVAARYARHRVQAQTRPKGIPRPRSAIAPRS